MLAVALGPLSLIIYSLNNVPKPRQLPIILCHPVSPNPVSRQYIAPYPAARSVFARSIAIVIGPTPPGTGVMADAFSATAS